MKGIRRILYGLIVPMQIMSGEWKWQGALDAETTFVCHLNETQPDLWMPIVLTIETQTSTGKQLNIPPILRAIRGGSLIFPCFSILSVEEKKERDGMQLKVVFFPLNPGPQSLFLGGLGLLGEETRLIVPLIGLEVRDTPLVQPQVAPLLPLRRANFLISDSTREQIFGNEAVARQEEIELRQAVKRHEIPWSYLGWFTFLYMASLLIWLVWHYIGKEWMESKNGKPLLMSGLTLPEAIPQDPTVRASLLLEKALSLLKQMSQGQANNKDIEAWSEWLRQYAPQDPLLYDHLEKALLRWNAAKYGLEPLTTTEWEEGVAYLKRWESNLHNRDKFDLHV